MKMMTETLTRISLKLNWVPLTKSRPKQNKTKNFFVTSISSKWRRPKLIFLNLFNFGHQYCKKPWKPSKCNSFFNISGMKCRRYLIHMLQSCLWLRNMKRKDVKMGHTELHAGPRTCLQSAGAPSSPRPQQPAGSPQYTARCPEPPQRETCRKTKAKNIHKYTIHD